MNLMTRLDTTFCYFTFRFTLYFHLMVFFLFSLLLLVSFSAVFQERSNSLTRVGFLLFPSELAMFFLLCSTPLLPHNVFFVGARGHAQ